MKARESNLGEQKREIRESKSWLTPGISDADISHNDKIQYQTTGHGPEESKARGGNWSRQWQCNVWKNHICV